MLVLPECTPQKSNIDTKPMAIFRAGTTFSKAHLFGYPWVIIPISGFLLSPNPREKKTYIFFSYRPYPEPLSMLVLPECNFFRSISSLKPLQSFHRFQPTSSGTKREREPEPSERLGEGGRAGACSGWCEEKRGGTLTLPETNMTSHLKMDIVGRCISY